MHKLVNELSKNDGTKTKPTLHEKKYKKRRIDLASLMDKNMGVDSNIFNVTIGEIIDRKQADEEEKKALKEEVQKLRLKVIRLEEEKKSLGSTNRSPPAQRT